MKSNSAIEDIGIEKGKIAVELSTRFLEHFSEQLYSSPQKAFEELIANSWDAGADFVDVRVAIDSIGSESCLMVFDNGVSMNEDGLRDLWHIAFSPKVDRPNRGTRKVIGKFGIGKLATFVLANKLTYICKADDGIIRRVTMNYSTIESGATASENRLIRDVMLDVYEVPELEVGQALSNLPNGREIWGMIQSGVDYHPDEDGFSEYGEAPNSFIREQSDTWTLVILTEIKPIGKEIQVGRLRRMLSSALPLGEGISIRLNGDFLRSTKFDAKVLAQWLIGPGLGIDKIRMHASEPGLDDAIIDNEYDSNSVLPQQVEEVPVTYGDIPFPHAVLPGVGTISGMARLFEDRVSGAKSDKLGDSNGFHVNVLGRVVNQGDSSFGEENLSHAVWSRFRLAIRVDGLNKYITTDREKVKDHRDVRVLRAFLRSVFNRARSAYDSDENANLVNGADLLVGSLGVLSLHPLRSIISDSLRGEIQPTWLVDESEVGDKASALLDWRDKTSTDIRNALSSVQFEAVDDESFAKYRLRDHSIVVNTEHPFVVENGRSKAEKEIVRTIAMINILSDMYALELGIGHEDLDRVRRYRDGLMRFQSISRRTSAATIIRLLAQAQHESGQSKKLEMVVADGLRHLGFHVRDLGKPGEPEGIASAYVLPAGRAPSVDDPHPPLYSFSFDAKSSKHEVAKTGNVSLDGVAEHRKKYHADYALVVAPGYSDGALARRCDEQKVAPMRASELGRLLQYTIEYGAIPLSKLEEVLLIYDPNQVISWVDDLESWLREQRVLTLDVFLGALESLKGKVPDALAASMIAYQCREVMKVPAVTDADVLAVASGLAVLVPDLIGVDSDKVVVNVSAVRFADSVRVQLEKLELDLGGQEA